MTNSTHSSGHVEWRAPGSARHSVSTYAVGTPEEVRAHYEGLVEGGATDSYTPRPQHVWRWQIAGYLYLGGLGAGAFAVAVILDWLGFGLVRSTAGIVGDRIWDWPKALVLWGPLVTGVGASLLILDLGRNRWRFFTAGNNPRTSWMARGFSILFSFIVLACAVAAVWVFAPGWRVVTPAAWRILEAVAVLAALGTAVYTGVLLRSMTYVPAWNARLIPLLFFVSALSTGAMGVLLGAVAFSAVGGDSGSADDMIRSIEVFEPLIVAVEGVVLVLYIRSLSRGKPEAALSLRILVRGTGRYLFWIGVVGCALALPLTLGLANLAARSQAIALLAAASVLVGGLILRLAILGIGVKELPPLYKLGEWRARHALQAGA